MERMNLIPGTDEWHAFRRRCSGTASEAPIMMGASNKMRRDELLSARKFGIERETPDFLQKIFDKGHTVEAMIKPHLAERLGETLFAVTGVETFDCKIALGASFDGLTMMGDKAVEIKQWNQQKAAIVQDERRVPDEDYWQVVQQSVVGGMIPVLYAVSDGTPQKTVTVEYAATEDDKKQLLAGWRQFYADMETHEHIADAPKAVAEPVMDLPAVAVKVTGDIALTSNLDVFGNRLREFIDKLDPSPSDDQAFANAEQAIKVLKKAEDALDSAEEQALTQTSSIDDLIKMVGMLRKLARDTRLAQEKLVKVRKEQIKVEIQQDGVTAWNNHLAVLAQRLGGNYMPPIANQVDFAGAMKGKKTVASLRGAVNDLLAKAKIRANEIADQIGINLEYYRAHVGAYAAQFPDLATLLDKAPDDFRAVFKMRIAEFEEAERKREEALREKIREEEAARLVAEQKAKEEAEAAARMAAEARERVEREQVMPEESRLAAAQRASGSVSLQEVREIAEAMDQQAAAEVADHVCVGEPPSLSMSPPRVNVGTPGHIDWGAAQRSPVNRPSDDAIIAVLANQYKVKELTVIRWLFSVDLELAEYQREYPNGQASGG